MVRRVRHRWSPNRALLLALFTTWGTILIPLVPCDTSSLKFGRLDLLPDWFINFGLSNQELLEPSLHV